jgi:hypothetical protein
MAIHTEKVVRSVTTSGMDVISAELVINNLTGTWFQLDFNFVSPPDKYVSDNRIPLTFLIAPLGEMRVKAQFAEGQYIQYDATRISSTVDIMLALDMITRGLFGVELTGLDGEVDLTKGVLADLLGQLKLTLCAADAVQLASCIRDGDVLCMVGKLAEFLNCIAQNQEATKLVKQIVSKLWGANVAKGLIEFSKKGIVQMTLELLSLVDSVPKMGVLFNETLIANYDGWARIECRR